MHLTSVEPKQLSGLDDAQALITDRLNKLRGDAILYATWWSNRASRFRPLMVSTGPEVVILALNIDLDQNVERRDCRISK
ncbi:hypothetical protein AS890_22885 [Rhizobium anhuiense bv. trifolii]|nr:hypothetical protein AS890_22885 [Rhizobium anhuiense bv. trifolii]